VDLDRAHRDVQLVGDDLVELAGQDQLHDLFLAARQLGQSLGHGVAGGDLGLVAGVELERLDHQVDQVVVVEGLLDEIVGAVLEGRDRHRDVAVAGQEDHRQRAGPLAQGVEAGQAVHAAHADVQHDAAPPVGLPGGQEVLGRGPAAALDSAGLEQPLEGVADCFVVVDDVG